LTSVKIYSKSNTSHPSDGNYKGSSLEIRDSSAGSLDSWRPIGFVSSAEELVVYVPNSSATYEVRANPVGISGKASNEYATNSITLTSTAGQTVIGSGNKITTSATTGDATNGQGVEISTNGIKGYNSSGVAKFTHTATALAQLWISLRMVLRRPFQAEP